MTTAIIVAAGKSERMGNGVDKSFISLVNKPVVAWSLLAFERSPVIDQIVLVVRKEQVVAAKAVVKMFGISKIHAIVHGGNRRQDSVAAGLAACDIDTRRILVHDGARPCIQGDVIADIVEAIKKVPAAATGRKMTDTVKQVDKGLQVSKTLERDKLWAVQTPQGFQAKVLRDAYAKLGKRDVTDDCEAVELAGEKVKMVESRKPNIKITTVEDLQLASALLR